MVLLAKSPSYGRSPLSPVFFFGGENSLNFNLKNKYDFNLYKGFSIEKNAPKFARFRQKKKFPNCQIFIYDQFQQVAKEYRRILIFFLFSCLVYSQIWLNHLMDDHHFSYITKLKQKKKKPW
jgi:hypothetical protein